MAKILLSILGWAAGLLVLAVLCWLLGVYLGWPFWKSAVLFLGIVVAFIVLSWLRRRWQAWQLRRRLARPSARTAESTARLDADWRAGIAALRQSRLSRFGSPLYVLPWFLALGPDDTIRSAMLRRAASGTPVTAGGDETPALQWWLLPGMVMLDPAPSANAAVIAPSASNWGRMLHWMLRSRRREPLNGLVLSFSAAWLTNSGDAELAEAGHALRTHLDELTRVYNAHLPVYILLTNCESVSGFSTWAQTLPGEADRQAMGYLAKGRAPSVGEFINDAFGHIVARMCDLRVLLGVDDRPSQAVFSLPERLATLAGRIDKVLRPAFQATPYSETPLLRGLFLSGRRQNESEHGADCFSAGLLNDVLPTQRNAWQPLEHFRHWRRFLQHAAVACWLLVCVGAGLFLVHAFDTARAELQVVSQDTLPKTVDFSGGISSDLHALRSLRHSIHSLEGRSTWEKRWMPFQNHVNLAQDKLEQAYTSAFYSEVLTANLNPLLVKVMNGSLSGPSSKPTIAMAQNLVRRINLLNARLAGKSLKPLPSPGPELAVLLTTTQNGSMDPFDGLLLGDMYRDYLAWQTDTHLLADEQRVLQKALATLGLSSRPIQWVSIWAQLQPQLQPVRVTDFWNVSDASGLPEVPAVMTLKGKKAVTEFLHELSQATGDTKVWNQRQAEYQQLFLGEGLQSWYAFSDAFLYAPDLLGDSASRRTVLSALMTTSGPYHKYLGVLAQLGNSLPANKQPEWLALAIKLNKLEGLVELPGGNTPQGKGASSSLTTLQNLKVVQNFADKIVKDLPKGTSLHDLSGLDDDQKSLTYMQDYLKGVRATVGPLQQGDGAAMNAAVNIWSFGHDPKVKNVPLIDAHTALEKLRDSYGAPTDTRTAIVWQLAAGPMDFTLDYAGRSAGCTLQNQWESNVMGTVKGLTDKQLADTLLYGDRGQVNAFLDGNVKHFVSRDSTRYKARIALGDKVPFSGQFYAFASLAQLRKSQMAGQKMADQRQQQANTALKEQATQLDKKISKLEDVKGNVTLSTLPPMTNAQATLRPQSITLTLQCAKGPITLTNLNFANSQVFPWSMSSCADTELAIQYPGFTLSRQWGGASGFVDFLKTFASGQHRYTPADFPAQASAMTQAGIKWLDITYKQQGQAAVLKAFDQADKLNVKAKEINDKLDAARDAAAKAPQQNSMAGPVALPPHIIVTCMGPAARMEEFMSDISAAPHGATASAQQERRTDKTVTKEVDAAVATAEKGEKSGKNAPAKTQASTARGHGEKHEDKDGATGYAVQVGIFAQPEQVRKTLKEGHYTVEDKPITLNGNHYRNIRIIGYATKQAAQEAAQKVGQLLHLKPLVMKQ